MAIFMSPVFLTVMSGTAVFVLGQILQKFFIEPIQELHKLRGEIADGLIFYANVYSNPRNPQDLSNEYDRAQAAMRQLASRLLARTHAIPWYSLWDRLRFVPKRKNVAQASSFLIGLSNGVYDGGLDGGDHNSKRRREIEALLKLETGNLKAN
jgi:hypothetical protein